MACGAGCEVLPRVRWYLCSPSPTLLGPSVHDLVTCRQCPIVPSCLVALTAWWHLIFHCPPPLGLCLAPRVLLFPLPRTPCPLGPGHSYSSHTPSGRFRRHPPAHRAPPLGCHSSLCLPRPLPDHSGCHHHWWLWRPLDWKPWEVREGFLVTTELPASAWSPRTCFLPARSLALPPPDTAPAPQTLTLDLPLPLTSRTY